MRTLIKNTYLALICFMLGSTEAAAGNIVIETFSLDNGLEVIVIPNRRVPAISHMLWFPNGGADDPSGKSGLTHFHEHVMFRGTANFPAGEFESTISRLGGNHNAFTGYDTTGYYVNIPKTALPRIMELEADRIRGIRPSDADIIKEREVIIEERRQRVDNNPTSQFHEQLNSILFVNHPYGTPLIGWLHEMEGLTKDDVLELHENHYSPNNATLILAGDITMAAAKPLVERYYGRLKERETKPRNRRIEPPIRAAKRLTMHHERVKEPEWQRNYIAPSVNTEDKQHGIPLMLFTEWLGGSDTSYLYQELVVKQKIATRISAGYNPFSIGPSSMSIRATPAPKVSMEKLEKAIDAALEKAQSITLAPADITRTKTLLKAETIFAREGLQGIAYLVGWMKMNGLSTNYVNEWESNIEAVTTTQMTAAAKVALDLQGSVTGMLLPEAEAEAE